MKKWMKLGLAFASVALLTGCTSANSRESAKNEKQATNSDTVKVGLNYELSGAVSDLCAATKRCVGNGER